MASGLYLTLLVGPVIPLPAPKPVVDALTSVTVTTSATGRSGFQLSFTLADRSILQALFLLAPPGVELRVVIMVTVNGIPQVLMDGVMREHEVQPSAGNAGSTMTITGEDLTAAEKRALGLSVKRLACRQDKIVHSSLRAAGVHGGDMVLCIDDQPLEMTVDQFLAHVRKNYLVGDRITLSVLRKGKRLDLPLKLR